MLKVVGAGLGRTGTNSSKLALETLLGGRCYHMFELVERDQDVPAWEAATHGEHVDWDALMAGYVACVDWPASAFWSQISAANPDTPVLLSLRGSTEEWWGSMESTIAVALSRPAEGRDARSARGDVHPRLGRTRGRLRGVRAPQPGGPRRRAAQPSHRMAPRRWLGPDLRRPVAPRAGRALSA